MRSIDRRWTRILHIGAGFLLSPGCGSDTNQTATPEAGKVQTPIASSISVRLDRPSGGEAYRAGDDVRVAGTVTIPPGSPAPDVFTVQFLRGTASAGSYAIPLKTTDRDDVYGFDHVVNAPHGAGDYELRGEAVVASELATEVAAVGKKKPKPLAAEPGRAASTSVRLRVVAKDAKTK